MTSIAETAEIVKSNMPHYGPYAEEAARLTPRSSWASRLVRRAGAPNGVRSAGAAGPSAQSLSIAE